jgi:hypothetical protein
VSRLTWVRNQRIRQGFGYRTFTLYGPSFQTVHLPRLFLRVIPIAPRNPRWTCVHPVWAVPRSLATTDGIAACFLFLRVLRCFTSPGWLPATMDSSQGSAVLPAEGFPIRTSTDRSLVGGSPWLFAATHVLHRLSEPRHPPHALSSLVTLNSGLPSQWLERLPFKVEIQILRRFGAREDLAVRCSSYPSYSVVRVLRRRVAQRRPGLKFPEETGGADRNRTDDIQLAKLALYQLSYSPTMPRSEMVGLGGFEPPTSRLSGVRSKPTEL